MTHSILSSNLTSHNQASLSNRSPVLFALVAALFLGLLGTVSTGWGSADDYNDLDDSVVMKWGIMHKPNLSARDDVEFEDKKGKIDNDGAFSIRTRKIDGINRVRAILYTSYTFSLEELNTSDVVPAKDLYKFLGISKKDYNECMSELGISLSVDTFPSNLAISYQQLRKPELLNDFVESQINDRKALRSFGGNRATALWAVEFFCKSWISTKGKPILFHLNLMGDLPEYSKDFMDALGIFSEERARIILPKRGKWFPAFQENLNKEVIEYYTRGKALDI